MIRRLTTAVLVCFAFVGGVFADDKFVVPAQKIVGAEEAFPSNEMIVLKVSPITEKPKYLEDVKYTWVVMGDDKPKANVFQWPDNTTVGFGRGNAKKVQVFLMINYLYAVHDKDDPKAPILEVAQRNSGLIALPIKFTDDPAPNPNPPNPNPNPNPNPAPDLPVGKFGLAKNAYSLAYTTVNDTSRLKGSQALATSLEGVASSISAGAVSNPEDILKNLKNSNDTAFANAGVSKDDWDDFGTKLQAILYQLYKDKKLSVASDYADAFRELATGLKAVK